VDPHLAICAILTQVIYEANTKYYKGPGRFNTCNKDLGNGIPEIKQNHYTCRHLSMLYLVPFPVTYPKKG
jgi:hypothetical protein